MPIAVLDPLADGEWDNRIKGLAQASIFHSRAWAEVLVRSYGFPRRYVVLEEGGDLRAVLPVMEVRRFGGRPRAVALPFSDFVPIATNDPQAGEAVTEHLLQQGGAWGWQELELRGVASVAAPATDRYYRHEIPLLADQGAMWSRLKSSARTAIRGAESHGVSVARATGSQSLRDFGRLNELTRRRHGLPPQPERFFRAIDELMLQRGLGEIWTASYEGQAIAAALFLIQGDQAVFKYGCSDYRWQRLRANNLLLWRALGVFGQRGVTRLCLGRTALAHEGLRRFKTGLGAREDVVNYGRYDFRRAAFLTNVSGTGAWYNRVFRVLPLWMNRRLGNWLYHFAA